MERIDFSQLFKNNNWDPFKISRSLILEILLQLDSEKKNQNQQNQQKNKDVLLESKYLKEQKKKLFLDIMKQLKVYLNQVRKNQDTEEEFICIQLQESLEFHKCIAGHEYNYSVISLLDTRFQPKTYENQIQLQSLLNQTIQNYFNNQDEQNINYHKALLANTYHNLQKEQYSNAKDLLDKLSKFYNLHELDRSQSDEEKNLQLGFIESVHTYMALCYLYTNKLKDLKNQIEYLKNFLTHINDETMKERIENHVDLFYIHFYFINQKLNNSKIHLTNLGDNLEKSLLLFFQNQSSQLLSYIETIYYHLFGNELFQVFKQLQLFEVGENINITKIKKSFQKFKSQIIDKDYSYGKGLILILSVIYTILLRLGKQYDEAIKNMNLIFQICKQTSTDFQKFLELFFKYNRLICYLYKMERSNKFKQEYKFFRYLLPPGSRQNNLYIFFKKYEKYIFKKQIQQTTELQKFKQLNEACIQMLLCHPNIQNIEEVFAVTNNEIVIVQKMQGENLNKLLINKKIDQEKAMGYIQQIMKAFCYLHSLNIIHSDFKLENVVTVLDDDTKIKIIDFGFSQIKIFNKFFTPLGYTKGYEPIEEKYTFESDIFSIGKSINKIYANNKFYKSMQMEQLINQMIDNSIQNRCTIKQASHKFQLEMVTYKIFMQIISKEEKFQNYDNQIYKDFADSIHFLFEKFRRFYYSTFSVQQEPENKKTQFIEFQNKYKQFNIIAITQQILLLLDENITPQNQSFVECLADNDIKLFVLKLLSYEKRISQNQNIEIQIQLLEECFRQSNYEKNELIDNLINKIEDNSKETNTFYEQIEKKLDCIQYSKDELKLDEEYLKLINNIEKQLQDLENKQDMEIEPNIQSSSQNNQISQNTQNKSQPMEIESNWQSNSYYNIIQHSSENSDIKNINAGDYQVSQSIQYQNQFHEQASSQSYFTRVLGPIINQDSQNTNTEYIQESNSESYQINSTQYSQSQTQIQFEQQSYYSSSLETENI